MSNVAQYEKTTCTRKHRAIALRVVAWGVGAGLNAASAVALAADYPSRPIRIVVGFSPGGNPDIAARHIGPRLSESLKQPVIVDNRTGAGGTIAAQLVARSVPDGHTLLSVSAAHAVTPAITEKLAYDTLKDFAGITVTAVSKYVLVTAPASGLRSVKDLLTLARAKPGHLNFSSGGIGSGTHFAAEIFRSMSGIDAVHVPFKGIPEGMSEVIAGRAHFMMAPLSSALGQVRDGRLVALGLTSLKRESLLPDVAPIAEAGVPGYQSLQWAGLLVPVATPRPLVERLNREVVRVLGETDLRTAWAAIGLEPRPTTPAAFDQMIREEVALFTRIARAREIRAE